MKLLKVTKKDVEPKRLPVDSRTNAQIKQRVAGYTKKAASLNLDIIRYLQMQTNVNNPELSDLIIYVNKIAWILDKITTKLNSL